MNITEIIKDIPLYQEIYGDLLNYSLTEKDLINLPQLSRKDLAKNFPENWTSPSVKKIIEHEDYEFMTTSGTSDEKVLLLRPKKWWLNIEKKFYESYLKENYPEYSNFESRAILTTAICSNTVCYKKIPPYEERIVGGFLHLNITEDPNNWTKEDIKRIVDEIDRFKPQCFHADSVYLALFFKFLKKYDINPPSWIPKLLLLTYEYCPRKCINIIKSHWNTPICIIIGTTELGYMYYQDSKGIFRLDNNNSFIYLKPIKNKPDFYEIIFTSFRNPYMPLINYTTGDIVYINPKKENDSNFSVNQLMERTKSITYTKNNSPITVGEIDNLLAEIDNDILIYKLDFSYENKLIFRYTTFHDQKLTDHEIRNVISILNNLYEGKYLIETSFEKELIPAPSGKFDIVKKT